MNKSKKAIPVIAENINIGEILEFPSKLSLAKYFEDLYCIESSSKNVDKIIKQKKPYRKTWKVRIKE